MKFKRSVSIILLFIAFIALSHFGRADGVTLPTSSGLASGSLKDIISNITKWILGVFGFLAIISFILSGTMYLMGGSMTGEKKDVSGAKKQMQWSIIGVIVGLAGYVIIVAVNSLLGGSSTNF
ncbi:MAG: hypothetical protein Q8L09_04695 [Candidatus Moranbacteria bacterium]|nr:hypothetical protein [Candidatus Moranbacteria bacterium]